MIINPHVPLNRLVLSLSEALDQMHPGVVDHQQRVAYIAVHTARHMDRFSESELLDIFHAAALHDVGLVGAENRYKVIRLSRMEGLSWHDELGYRLLKDNPLFTGAAELMRCHHLRYDRAKDVDCQDRPFRLGNHVMILADAVERSIDRDVPILQQHQAIIRKVRDGAGTLYHPGAVEAFCEVARTEAFWLDVVSDRIYSILLQGVNWPELVIDEAVLIPIGMIFARLVDAVSPWTAVHTAGVTATSVALSGFMDFSPREQHLMRAAGYLHDLGKLAVPRRIVDKPDKLTVEEMAVMRSHTYHTFRILNTIGGLPQVSEWAAFHHERLDGTGYPFHHTAEDLTLGSRILAVADVFSSLIEDRPYRKAFTYAEARALLRKMVDDGALDGQVVDVLEKHNREITAVRREEQKAYAARQKELFTFLEL